MNSLFASLYEKCFGIWNSDYPLIFQNFYDHSYSKFGWSFILIPLLCWFLFYYIWKYPYGRIFHWLFWLVITIFIVSGVTYSFVNTEIFASSNLALNDALADSSTGYEEYAKSLPLVYAFFNGLLTIIVGIILSIIMKQKSKIQIHLPI